MYPTPSRASSIVACIILAACAKEPATAVDGEYLDVAADLEFVLPSVTHEQKLASSAIADSASGPALVTSEREGPPTDQGSELDYSNATSAIWNEKTVAAFVPGYLSMLGRHNYQGNKGRVETRASLRFEGQSIGSQSSAQEQQFPFVIDFGRVHYIWTSTRIYTDRECGLTGVGDSTHKAWWEAVAGGPVFNFSSSEKTSISELARQADCAPEPTFTDSGGGGGSPGGEMTCWYLITYDLWSGEVYDVDLLYCTEGG